MRISTRQNSVVTAPDEHMPYIIQLHIVSRERERERERERQTDRQTDLDRQRQTDRQIERVETRVDPLGFSVSRLKGRSNCGLRDPDVVSDKVCGELRQSRAQNEPELKRFVGAVIWLHSYESVVDQGAQCL